MPDLDLQVLWELVMPCSYGPGPNSQLVRIRSYGSFDMRANSVNCIWNLPVFVVQSVHER